MVFKGNFKAMLLLYPHVLVFFLICQLSRDRKEPNGPNPLLMGLSMKASAVSLSSGFPNCFLFKLCIGSDLLGSFEWMPLGSHGRGAIKVSHWTMIPSQN